MSFSKDKERMMQGTFPGFRTASTFARWAVAEESHDFNKKRRARKRAVEKTFGRRGGAAGNKRSGNPARDTPA